MDIIHLPIAFMIMIQVFIHIRYSKERVLDTLDIPNIPNSHSIHMSQPKGAVTSTNDYDGHKDICSENVVPCSTFSFSLLSFSTTVNFG